MDKAVRIGLQINSIDSDYSKSLIDGVAGYCRANGLGLLIFSGRAHGWPYDFVYQNTVVFKHLHPGNIDALIIATGTQCNFISRDEFVATLDPVRSLPMISLSIALPGIPGVMVDNDSGFEKLLAHLVDVHLCSQIAILKGPEDNVEATRRFEHYRRFLKNRGITYDPRIVFYGDFAEEYSLKSVKGYLDGHALDFDALVSLNDTMAIGCLHYFEQAGIRVPEDVIVTGFDDIIRSRYEIPSLTTVDQNLEMQGEQAARFVHDLYRKKTVPLTTTLQTTAVFRQSCGCVSREETGYVTLTEASQKIQSIPKYSRTAGIGWFRIQDDIVKLRQYLAHMVSVLSIHELVWGCIIVLRSLALKPAL